MFTLKDVKGAVVGKDLRQYATEIGSCLYGKNHKWEDAETITDILEILESKGLLQSSVKLRLNREKLAKLHYEYFNYPNKWKDMNYESIREANYRFVDAIIAEDKDIVEVDKCQG